MVRKITTIGIIGGGQLGRMICFDAQKLGFHTVVFVDHDNSPASFVTNKTIVANYDDKAALAEFASLVDVITFEFENIPFAAAEFLTSKVPFYPNPEILKTTQNRILEKNFLNSIGVKTADYAEVPTLAALKKNLAIFGKAILKTATMGYDGKGQFVLKNEKDADIAWEQAGDQELVLEGFCPFESEASVIVARSTNGEVSAYEPLTNIHKNGILDESIYPAKISDVLSKKAQDIAIKIAQELDLVGLLAVEFFVMKDELLVNEVAPRPHNSGHFSMDANVTPQFEQLIRAVASLPLGSVKFHSKGYMKNLIGDDVNDVDKFYQNSQAKIHLYAKSEAKDGRKMGHVNILS